MYYSEATPINTDYNVPPVPPASMVMRSTPPTARRVHITITVKRTKINGARHNSSLTMSDKFRWFEPELNWLTARPATKLRNKSMPIQITARRGPNHQKRLLRRSRLVELIRRVAQKGGT